MESARPRLLPLLAAALLLLLPLLGARAQEDAELQPRALDIYSAMEDPSHEKELVSIPRLVRGSAGQPCASLWLCPGHPSHIPIPIPPESAAGRREKPGLVLCSEGRPEPPPRTPPTRQSARAEPLTAPPLGATRDWGGGPAVSPLVLRLPTFRLANTPRCPGAHPG